eukprot:maker-scaffold2058_size21661-snap-gene-0.8 protein:Tk01020 transcript:maker-scaffold2058_size21661-snap-gene-0.8-mRNA-1 annotation:"hypothetical protein HELRODRAFT_62550"
MSVIQSCSDLKDTLDLFRPQGLYLKPISRLNISVQLPQLKKSGAKISNWEVMERVKEMAKPFHFSVFKVAKSSLEFIRFEAEIDNFGSMDQILAKVDMKTIKLSGFQELLKVRAAESRPPFPTRSEWDGYFRENPAMSEMKAGERPDTVHLRHLPSKWFVNAHDKSGTTKERPSEYVLKKVFATFGEIRAVDIPLLDPYRDQMKSTISGIQTFNFGQDLVFEAYVQYKEYIGFVKAMNSLKGMKLLYQDRYEERAWVANVVVDFDRSKHLAESTIKRRAQERDKLVQKEREHDEMERREEELQELKRSEELRRMAKDERQAAEKHQALAELKAKRRLEREERRRRRKMEQKSDYNEEEVAEKIALEERKLLIAQRKLESIRLLDELLDRVKAIKHRENNVKNLEKDLLRTAAKEAKGTFVKAATILSTSYKDQDEKELRDKLVHRLKQKEVNRMEHCGERIRKQQFLRPDSNMTDGLEDISDEENLTTEESQASEDVDSNAEADNLHLTSTDEETPRENKVGKKKKKKERKKSKKEKKKKKKEKLESKKKRKELDSQIKLAKRIADRDQRSRSRERQSSRVREEDDHKRGSLRPEPENYSDFKTRRAEERAKQRLEERALTKRTDQAKEELYDQMVNPHLYGTRGGGYRRLKPGEHYEDVQKRELEEQIRLKKRMERDRVRLDQERKPRPPFKYPRDGMHQRSRSRREELSPERRQYRLDHPGSSRDREDHSSRSWLRRPR